MKQHITVDQLNELSDKSKEKLRDWWQPQLGDIYVLRQTASMLEKYYDSPEWNDEEDCYYDDGEYSIPKDKMMYAHDGLHGKMYPLFSIGQMIEFLDRHTDNLHNEEWYSKIVFGGWGGEVLKGYKGELCDSLWEDVREELEK